MPQSNSAHKRPPRVLVVSLNYRTAAMTLRSLRATLVAVQGMDADVVVVDNDSQDGSYETILKTVEAERLPVRVLQSGHNGGFGAGNNAGIRARMADGGAPDYVYLLNSDAFPEADAIRILADHLDAHPKAGIVGSHLLSETGETHPTAFRFPSVASEFEGAIRFGPVSRLMVNHRVSMDVPEGACAVDWVAGASLMVRWSVLQEIGLFDEAFFLYFEETDLCLRATRAGFETHCVPQSRVVHIGSVSTGMGRWARVPRYWLESRWHYFSKNHGRWVAVLATLAHLAGGVLWRARMLIERKAPVDPPQFLRDLVQHDAGAMIRPLPGARETEDWTVDDARV